MLYRSGIALLKLIRNPALRLLFNFRKTAGLHTKAKPYGGWEHPKVELRGHFVGHYLSAAALMYKYAPFLHSCRFAHRWLSSAAHYLCMPPVFLPDA